MCGLNGFNFLDEALAQKMNRALAHRGPDASGIWQDKSVTLGQTLLSIRGELLQGGRPVSDPDSPWVLLFNGEIYNTEDLRARLGQDFRKETLDTRLLYFFIRKVGWDWPVHVHGMYAVVLYNRSERRLRLYRDPAGQKPLYYYWKDGRFAFSSELKGLAELPIDLSVDLEAVEIAACLGYIPAPKTLFRYISKVSASEEIRVDFAEPSIKRVSFRAQLDGQLEQDPLEAIHRTVSEHRVGRHPISVDLSGGLDSSIVLHWLRKDGIPVQTWTTRFDTPCEKWNDDANLAARLAKHYEVDHREIEITSGAFLDALPKAYLAVEEPNYNNSIPHAFLLAKAQGRAGAGERIVLTGDGGDEIFAGYPHHHEVVERTPALNALRYDFPDVPSHWFHLRRHKAVYLNRRGFNVRRYVVEAAHRYTSLYGIRAAPIPEAMAMDRAIWLPDENFVRTDKLGMSQSIETRAPLAYPPLRRAMDLKIRDSEYTDGKVNKLFLRRAYKAILPDWIVNRPAKAGWKPPIPDWYDGKWKAVFLNILSAASERDSIVDWPAAIRSVEETPGWPGKTIHVYLSLALLKRRFHLSF